MTDHIHVTVATIVEQDGRFLLVEEMADGRRVYNQPAGHVELGEPLSVAAVRETLEETGWHVELTHLLGMALYKAPANGVTYYRTTFIARPLSRQPDARLDDGIIGPVWMSLQEMQANQSAMRSPLVIRVVEQYLSGIRLPLSLIDETHV
jgi:ADP-ribose pyrophosphatase YjhB (NUDIX family)